jgi:hypothetical protein
MPRVPTARRAMSVALSSMILMAATLIPLAGMTGAASSSTTCPPGETLTAAPSAGSGNCILKIQGPSSVRTGISFTVQVLVTTDGSTIATSDPCGSKAPITLTIFFSESSTSQTVNASGGTATFTLNFATAGTYDLLATSSTPETGPCEFYNYSSDEQQIMAVTIPDNAPIAPCPKETDCVQAASGGGSQATGIADQDTLSGWTSFDFGPFLATTACAGDARKDTNGVLEFFFDRAIHTTNTKVIIFALDGSLVSKGISMFNVCWYTPSGFVDNTGNFVFTGNLPNCPSKNKDQTPPCVIARTSGQHNAAFLTVLAPADDPNDPFGFGH